MGIGIGDNKLIYKTTPQDVVWSEIDDPNKWEVQEPYGYFRYDMQLDAWVQNKEGTKGIAFYTAPPKKDWVGLTADEIWKCNKAENGSAVEFHICVAHQNVLDFAEALEAKLKEKNT